MNAIIYARYSSDNQTESSIDAQVRACKEYANKKNITIKEIYKDEAISGTTANRASYQKMLSDAFDGKFELILIHKYDRIARNLEEQVNLRHKLKQLNIKLIAVAQDYGEGKDAELSKGIQWVLGEYYSANLSEETRKGHKEIALKGMHNGGCAPFGYDVVEQKYIINESEAYWVRKLFSKILTREKLTNIIEEMSAAGVVGKRGKEMKSTQIYEILRNEKYTGTYIYQPDKSDKNIIRIENAFPAIIDKDTFDRVQDILAERKHYGPSRKHRCSGLVYCANCGAKMHHIVSHRKGHEYNSFYCSAHCGAGIVRDEVIDEAVDKYIEILFSEKNKGEVEKALIKLKKENKEKINNLEKNKNNLINKKELELKNIINIISSGKVNDNIDYFNEVITQKRKEIEELKSSRVEMVTDTQIKKWMQNIIDSNFIPSVFIDRIDAKKTEIRIFSTLTSVVGIDGCGGTQEMLPTTLLTCKVCST